ncbi:MAG: hypothetical protein A3C79_00450 [Candidatus Taylorbacteria bacterium RIFCSPHIGHO2_02_FULL_45_28]|uniref:Uncharacterized protein n=1 Tax=Candidatus Taylorbacteria bacterium RIFCSPHIGHO2_12_FULL_45_16 TaxID=1802315 RepID=A0A1G2N172_9BACT|nr:MAG: hypothetical protein A2830_01705 [Candidatus Taylorbacteria bacterium RIFCSPHIGHO2_01_FULL_44_110]OHA25492.1 MAG: hypothetical protein A3C79_00450 [Candidatus Taylorbacteria bacterium RIFCSPHIGHO2_02_FULL_45_28]OHA29159.1 MAG: hypothetical protein A3F51_00915 [Candidatus Taylorbacteria bacterium RIFCSPHIGHO2_12_FULL_45_16]OHA33381.1 MAG: hypothetical protein A3A23_01795 [Candidatus Taylorbacteria bacterium RIFCSPLOWO2_01_FULL_45_59]OHA44862.1 MAG: hypothetical protein A3G04_00870 [Candi
MSQKLTIEEFTLLAVDKLPKGDKQMIHTVYSGFNEAFREYFPGKDPVAEVNQLAKEGKISFRLCRGGAIIAKPGVIESVPKSKDTLQKMGV